MLEFYSLKLHRGEKTYRNHYLNKIKELILKTFLKWMTVKHLQVMNKIKFKLQIIMDKPTS